MFFQTVNPATGELVQTFEAISGDNLEVALATAHRRMKPTGACARWPFPAPPSRFRGEDNVAVLRRTGRRRRRDPARHRGSFGIPQPVKQGQHLTKQIERITKCN
jgi:hypothetical protein